MAIKILLACEESGTVRDAFTALGFDATSCDLMPSRTPGKHFQGDVLEQINRGGWDCMIAFPPCTHLALSGAKHFEKKRQDGRQQQGIDFFMAMVNAPINHIAIENPMGIMSTLYKKPTQIIQPWMFGDEYQKTTCLWLKNLPHLYHNAAPNLFDPVVTHVSKGEFYSITDKKTGKVKKMPLWYAQAKGFGGKADADGHSKTRSKTFPGIATAMANQWGEYLTNLYPNK